MAELSEVMGAYILFLLTSPKLTYSNLITYPNLPRYQYLNNVRMIKLPEVMDARVLFLFDLLDRDQLVVQLADKHSTLGPGP
jgi:hypothetical protein